MKRKNTTRSALPLKKRRYAPTPALRRVYETEKKGLDTVLTQSSIVSTTNTNDNAVVLNLIRTGNGSWNRIGKRVHLRSVRLRGQATYSAAPYATTGDLRDSLLRMVVVWDKQPSSGSIPTWDTIFGITAQDGTESSTIWASVRYDNVDRFSILKDSVIRGNVDLFNAAGGTTDAQVIRYHFDEYLKLAGKDCIYSGQSTPMTIADISSGALYVYFRASESQAGSATWSIGSDSSARLRYTD